MSWGEAVQLTSVLAADPSSQVAAALAGWQYPVSREWLALKSTHDKWVQTKFKKPYPVLPTPWDVKPARYGTPVDKAALRAVLDRHRALPAAVQVPTVVKGG